MLREALTAEKLGSMQPAEAAALFVARQSEGLSADEQRLLDEWLQRDEAHRHAFASAEHAWRSFDGAENDEILVAMRAHARAPQRRVLQRWWPALAAAALATVALSVVFVRPFGSPGGNQREEQARVEYNSSIGKVEEVQLADGSRMTLDADTVVLATFTADRRRVALQKGRALFEVARDASRPFTVSAGGRSVVAVGTQFDVNIVADGLTVTLLEGRVDITSLDSGRALVSLSPGQQYIERSGDATVRTIGADTENFTAWRKGLINFDDQPLAEAAAIMNRYSSEQIVIGDVAASIRVSGQFRAGDSRRFASTLAEMHRLDLVQEGQRIELAAKK